jgi:protein involved in polysaccharide export with SLBB domain
MIRVHVLTVALLACVPASLAAQPPSTDAGTYVLQRGDVLQIRLFYNPDLNELLPIRPDGMISLALVGDIQAAGLTPAELSKRLTERYATALRQPDTAVIVKEFSGQRVYVGGEVNRPGIVQTTGRLTALQSIVEAGGLKNSANAGQIVIVRDQGTPQPLVLTVDLGNPGAKTSDIMLQARDVVYVPKNRIAKVDEFVSRNIRDLLPLPINLGVSYIFGSALVR